MSEVKAVWRAMGRLTRAQMVMENYIHGPKETADWANMRVFVLTEVDACLAELRTAAVAKAQEAGGE